MNTITTTTNATATATIAATITETVTPKGLKIVSKGRIKKPSVFINALKPYYEDGYKIKSLEYNADGHKYDALLRQATAKS